MSASIYQQRIQTYSQQLTNTGNRLKLLSLARLICFAGFLFCGYRFFAAGMEASWLLPVFIFMAGFVWLLAYYQRVKDRQLLLSALFRLNQKELRFVTEHVADFEDGAEFVQDQHDFSGDLDVFGSSSLFQYLNRTGTYTGKQYLAALLQQPLQDRGEILAMQEAVKELSPQIDFRQEFSAHAELAAESSHDVEGIRQWLDAPLEFLPKKGLRVISFAVPALLILAIGYYAVTGVYGPMGLLLAVNWSILLLHVKKVNAMHLLISNKEKVLYKFSLLLQMVRRADWTQSAWLQARRQTASEADEALRGLARISSQLDQRLNLLVGLVLNSLVLYDLHCAFRLERWKARHRQRADAWLDVIARMEAVNSLATFAYNHPGYTYPEISDAAGMAGHGIGHPMIAPAECVVNDCSIGENGKFLIITGSNMSGKSTFLRSVGVNWLLAMTGAPVCAAYFKCNPLRIMTSMRIKDSIARHTSYFQAELLRLQHIIQVLKTGQQVFIILDEILKGTNSEDKLTGSQELVRHFLQYRCMGMIATHDLELGTMEAEYPDEVRNYCFESSLEDGQLYFDYRMRLGIARNKNATFLMRKMEII